MNEKNVPKLRFEGFVQGWEQRKLGEVVKITMGQSPSGKNYTENPTDHILVQGNADMKKGKVIPRIWTTQITKTAEPNDIILSVRAPVGDTGKTDYNVVLGRGVAGIKGNDFVYQTLVKMKETGFWTRYSTGSTFESINSTDLKEAVISIPNEKEQQKVGNFFKQLDDTIALYQDKLEKLKRLKQGFLQVLFANDERIPKVRFAGFSEEWEQRKLTDIIIRVNKSSSSTELPKVEFEDISSGEGRLNKNVTKKFDSRKGIEFEPEDILYGKLRPYLKNWLMPTFRGVALGDFWVFRANESIPYFIYSLIQTNKYQKAANDTSGTKMPRSDWKKVSNTDFLVSKNIKEQQKIGSFFKQIEDTISLYQIKVENLKDIKEAFLQKMFI